MARKKKGEEAEAVETVEPQVEAVEPQVEAVEAQNEAVQDVPFPLGDGHFIGPRTMSRRIHAHDGGIRQVQAALGLTENGLWSRRVADAVIAHQEAKGLQVTGLVDAATWESLLRDA